jgi:uncharacterized protein with von Willebrand factor type A (vWA) domain
VSVTSAEQTTDTLNVDLAALAVGIGQRLHEADMPVTPAQSEQYARSLQLVRPRSRWELYHTTRAIFVTAVEDLPTFDRVFRELFGLPGEPTADNVAVKSERALAATDA